MTVRELMAKLTALNPDQRIVVEWSFGRYLDILEVDECWLKLGSGIHQQVALPHADARAYVLPGWKVSPGVPHHVE